MDCQALLHPEAGWFSGYTRELLAVSDLNQHQVCSPLQLATVVGSVNWFNLLNRGLYSCLHSLFAFVRLEPGTSVIPLWPCALSELQLNLCLFGFWTVDLRRPWLGKVLASDASPSFGLGLCEAVLSPDEVRRAAAVAGRGAHYIDLEGRPPGGAPVVPRHGAQHTLPIRASAFKTVVSLRAKKVAHSGRMEADAAFLAVRRLVRSARSHHHRALVLIDATAVGAGFQKGRSSASTLRRPIARAMAAALAGGLRLRTGYIPSEWNPADRPSRGAGRPWPRHKPSAGAAFLRLETLLRQQASGWHRIVRCRRDPLYTESLSAAGSWSSLASGSLLSSSSCSSWG